MTMRDLLTSALGAVDKTIFEESEILVEYTIRDAVIGHANSVGTGDAAVGKLLVRV